MNGVRARSPLVTPAVAAVLVALIAVVTACSGASGDAAPDAPTLAPTGAPSATTVPAGSTTPGREPDTAGPPTTAPPSAACALAATVAEEDVAIALLTSGSDDDDAAGAAAEHRDALVEALTDLASSRSRIAGPADAVLDAGLASRGPGGPGGRRPGPVESLHVAMLRECGVRLAGSGVLRPDLDPDDSLDRLGLARLGGAPCDVAEVLRWADAHWRAAPNGGEQDRLGVVVRHALDALRLDGGGIDVELPADIGRADLSGWSLSSQHALAIVGLDADLRRGCDQRLEPSGLLMEGFSMPSQARLDALTPPAWGVPVEVDADTSHARWCAVADDIYAEDLRLATADRLELPGRERIGADLRLLLGALRIASRSGGSIATLDDVRDVVANSRVIERGDLSAPGRLVAAERRSIGELDRIMVANCGVGFSASVGLLGRFAWSSSFPDFEPSTPSPAATTTTSTTLPTYLPDTAVAVVGDSLTASAQTEIVQSLAALGLGNVVVDGQVSRRMTSSTDTIRSGESVVTEIAAVAAPRVWVIALGTNDVASGAPASSLRDSVRRVLDAIPPDALVVWVDTYIRDEPDAVVAGNRIIREVVAERPGAVVADFFSYGDDPGVVGSDGVHLTAVGRRLFANVIANGVGVALGRSPQFDLSTVAPQPTTTAATTTLAPGTAPPPFPTGVATSGPATSPPGAPTSTTGTTTSTTSTVP